MGAAAFNQPLGTWDVSSVTDTDTFVHSACGGCAACSDQVCLCVCAITDTNIQDAVDNLAEDGTHPTYGHISGWDVSQVTSMASLFNGKATFNQPIGSWVVAAVTTMGWMFVGAAAFNQPL